MMTQTERNGGGSMNIWDILILLAVGAALILAARMAGKRKGGCGCCPEKGTKRCHCGK